MGAIRVMCVGQGRSGLAEDRFVSTFHFTDGEAGVSPAGKELLCALAVAEFWNGVGVAPVAQNYALSAYISPYVHRTAQLISYDMYEPGRGGPGQPGRTPSYWPLEFAATADGSGGLPEEVAVVLTLHGLPPVTPRRRGRLYLGPLIDSAANPATTTDACRPQTNFIADIIKAASRVAGTPADGDYYWAIKSSLPAMNFVQIVSGYVDNAFDTQRRRGPDPTTRSPFIALVG